MSNATNFYTPPTLSISDKISDAESKHSWNSPLEQTERLFASRPRSISRNPNNTEHGGDRGDRAYIKLLSHDSQKSTTFNSSQFGVGTGGQLVEVSGYADFLLTGVSCNLEERLQVTQVFGDAEVVYHFGRQPMVFNLSGLLVDSVDNNWFINWLTLYRDTMRGSQLAKNYEMLKLVLPNMSLVGTINNFSWQQESANDVAIPFSFQFFAKSMEPTPALMTSGAYFPEAIAMLQFNTGEIPTLNQSSIEEIKRRSADLKKASQDPNTTSKELAEITNTLASRSNIPTIGLDGKAGYSASRYDLGSISGENTKLFNDWSTNLSGTRTKLFSGVFGVLSSLTKLVKSTTGNISGVVSVFSSGVNNVLRDINSISYGANSLVNTVNSTVQNAASQVYGVKANLQNTISSLKRTRGAISNAPSTIHSSLQNLVASGRINSNTPMLSGTIGHASSNKVLTLILRSRTSSGATLPLLGGRPMNTLAALNAGSPRTRERGPSL